MNYEPILRISRAGYRHIDPKKIEKRKKTNRGFKIPTVNAQFPSVSVSVMLLCHAETSPQDRYGYMNEEEVNLLTLVRQTKLLGPIAQFFKKHKK